MPRVYRPRATLLMAIGLSVLLVVAAVAGWQLLPAEVQVLFTGVQLATLVFFVLVMVGIMLGVALSSIRADTDGLTIRNGLRSHRIGWSQVEGFRFTGNDPWAYVVLSQDPGSRPLMAVQRVDGARAERAVADLRAVWQQHRQAAG